MAASTLLSGSARFCSLSADPGMSTTSGSTTTTRNVTVKLSERERDIASLLSSLVSLLTFDERPQSIDIAGLTSNRTETPIQPQTLAWLRGLRAASMRPRGQGRPAGDASVNASQSGGLSVRFRGVFGQSVMELKRPFAREYATGHCINICGKRSEPLECDSALNLPRRCGGIGRQRSKCRGREFAEGGSRPIDFNGLTSAKPDCWGERDRRSLQNEPPKR